MSERILGSNRCTKGSPFQTQRGPPPRMHRPGWWRYEQKEQRVTPVPISRVNCDLWCPGWDSKNLGGRPEKDPGYTSLVKLHSIFSLSVPTRSYVVINCLLIEQIPFFTLIRYNDSFDIYLFVFPLGIVFITCLCFPEQ